MVRVSKPGLALQFLVELRLGLWKLKSWRLVERDVIGWVGVDIQAMKNFSCQLVYIHMLSTSFTVYIYEKNKNKWNNSRSHLHMFITYHDNMSGGFIEKEILKYQVQSMVHQQWKKNNSRNEPYSRMNVSGRIVRDLVVKLQSPKTSHELVEFSFQLSEIQTHIILSLPFYFTFVNNLPISTAAIPTPNISNSLTCGWPYNATWKQA